jgi:hypothetical protein
MAENVAHQPGMRSRVSTFGAVYVAKIAEFDMFSCTSSAHPMK